MAIFHVLNRGIDKRNIFLDDQDRARFIHDLYEFNDVARTNNAIHVFNKYTKKIEKHNIGGVYELNHKKRELIVQIHTFVLMDNHYHLMLSPLVENGVSLFLQKLNAGYTKYFNSKYKREGQGPLLSGTKKIVIRDEAHFIHLPYYQHCNPLDFHYPEWRERELKDYAGASKFLESYKWSSHLDYLGIKNFPSVTYRKFLLDFFGGSEGYKKSFTKWLKDIELDSFKEITLE